MSAESRINIVCLKWGNKYGAEYVNRLYAAVQRHVDRRCWPQVRFLCFTDDGQGIAPGIEIHGLPYSDRLDIWWNKLWLFSLEMPIPVGETIFYIDLDTLITRDITDLIQAPAQPITVLRDFYHGIARTAGDMGSGLMSWQHGDYDRIWQEFWRDPDGHRQRLEPLGDQKWIEICTQGQRQYWQDRFPDRVVSFKVHCQWGLPDRASIICYHGRPNIPESATQHTRDWKWRLAPQPWVMQHWIDQ